MDDSCALDVAEEDENGVTLERIGAALNVSRQRVEQLERLFYEKLRAIPEMEQLMDSLNGQHDETFIAVAQRWHGPKDDDL